jgi:hypothetical protein
MTLLSPFTALVAALVAIPALLLLYFLKLRRRRLRMASTLLWRRSFEDLQVNVPFQRLRLSSLFVLQIAMLLLLLLALAEPVLQRSGPTASRILLLIDQSASMSARDVDGGTRLDAAKAAARQIVERLGRGGDATAVMVIAFGARARLVTGFESRRTVLLDAIDSIEPTDEEANLAVALELAATFASQREQGDEEPPDVILVSDGGVAPPPDDAGFALRAGRFRFVRIGPETPTDNVGIVAFEARRDYQDPTQVVVFARLVNTGPAPVETLVALFVGDEAGPIKRITVPAPEDAGDDADAPSDVGAAPVTFALELPGGAIVSARHNTRDVLTADDTAAVVLAPPVRPRIALVHGAEGVDPYLRDLLAGFEPRVLREMTLETFETIDPLEIDLGRRYELAVFDGVAPRRLPAIPTVVFGAAPPGIGTTPPSSEGAARILSWRRNHPLLRHVALDAIVYAGFGGLELPPGATPLVTGRDGPVAALLPARGTQHVVVGFALRRSNWPTHVSVTVFMQNVLDFLTLSRSGQSSLVQRPGDPVTVRVAADAEGVAIRGAADDVAAPTATPGAPGALVTAPAVARVGVYDVLGAEPPGDRLAVSMLSAVESDVRPRAALVVNAERVDAGAVAEAAPRGIWPWLAAGALGLLVVEWLLYCRLLRV